MSQFTDRALPHDVSLCGQDRNAGLYHNPVTSTPRKLGMCSTLREDTAPREAASLAFTHPSRVTELQNEFFEAEVILIEPALGHKYLVQANHVANRDSDLLVRRSGRNADGETTKRQVLTKSLL